MPPTSTDAPQAGRKNIPWRAIILLAAVATIMAASPFLGLGEKIGRLQGWIEGAGFWGPVVFILLYVAATVAALPGSAISIVAGVIFGAFWGSVLVINAATLGAALAFLVGRYLARDAVSKWLAGREKFQRLDKLTEEQGAIIVAVTRLVPLFPFNLLNYAFGLTRVRFLTYVGWSWLCMLPGTVLYVSGAGAVTEAIKAGRVPWVHLGVLAFVVALLAVIVPQARKRLKGRAAQGSAGKGD